jgi:hypothetical protein
MVRVQERRANGGEAAMMFAGRARRDERVARVTDHCTGCNTRLGQNMTFVAGAPYCCTYCASLAEQREFLIAG